MYLALIYSNVYDINIQVSIYPIIVLYLAL